MAKSCTDYNEIFAVKRSKLTRTIAIGILHKPTAHIKECRARRAVSTDSGAVSADTAPESANQRAPFACILDGQVIKYNIIM